MNLYQVDINTEIDAISVLVNAYDENEALAIAQTMFEQGLTESIGTTIINVAAFPACGSVNRTVSRLCFLFFASYLCGRLCISAYRLDSRRTYPVQTIQTNIQLV